MVAGVVIADAIAKERMPNAMDEQDKEREKGKPTLEGRQCWRKRGRNNFEGTQKGFYQFRNCWRSAWQGRGMWEGEKFGSKISVLGCVLARSAPP
jgi:hypothetical protein